MQDSSRLIFSPPSPTNFYTQFVKQQYAEQFPALDHGQVLDAASHDQQLAVVECKVWRNGNHVCNHDTSAHAISLYGESRAFKSRRKLDRYPWALQYTPNAPPECFSCQSEKGLYLSHPGVSWNSPTAIITRASSLNSAALRSSPPA